jgi:NAD(P)-dependent dehydrogenase (short-subunit alcohol dehydrogenase family)
MKSLKELMDLHGRVALVSGGGGHIGAAACEALAELGADIVVLDKSKKDCERTATQIHETYGVKTLPLIVDLTDDAAVKSLPGPIMEKFGRLDIVANSAAMTSDSKMEGYAVPFEEQPLEPWRKAFEVNLTSVFALVQACRDVLKESGNGSVINISSIYGIVGPDMRLYEGTDMGNPAAYAASKGGLLAFTRWLATVLAPDVRVNAISPGGVLRGQDEKFLKRYNERTPMRRMATEEDVKGAIAYLASDMSNYVTGQNLVIDGGWTAW